LRAFLISEEIAKIFSLLNGLCHIYELVMSRIRMSHVSHMNESCHTYEEVIRMRRRQNCVRSLSVRKSQRSSASWMGHVTHVNASCHIYEWIMSYIWKVMPHIWKSQVHMKESKLHIDNEDFLLILNQWWDANKMRVFVWCNCGATHSCLRCHAFTNVIELIWKRKSRSLSMRRSQRSSASWMGYVTYIKWVMSRIRMSHVTHTNESCHTYEWVVSHLWRSHIAYERDKNSSVPYQLGDRGDLLPCAKKTSIVQKNSKVVFQLIQFLCIYTYMYMYI